MKKRSKSRSRIKSKIKSKRRYKSKPKIKSKRRYKSRPKIKSKRLYKIRSKRRYKQKQYDYGLSNSKSEHPEDYTDYEISIMNRLVKILRKYEKVELIPEKYRENVLNETVKALQELNFKVPTEKISTNLILIWYITQIPDSKKNIKILISAIIEKTKHGYSEVEISVILNLLDILGKYKMVELITNEEDRKNILNETGKALQPLKIKNPIDETWLTKTYTEILNCYIDTIHQTDIQILIVRILDKTRSEDTMIGLSDILKITNPEYSEVEISVILNLLDILGKYKMVELITNEEDRKNILNETVIAIQLLKIKNPTEKIWIDKGNVGILNWYITQLSDEKKDIRMLISKILKKANP